MVPKHLGLIGMDLPETNIAPENRPLRKMKVVSQPSIFRCKLAVSFRECTSKGSLVFWVMSDLSYAHGVNQGHLKHIGTTLEVHKTEQILGCGAFLAISSYFHVVRIGIPYKSHIGYRQWVMGLQR